MIVLLMKTTKPKGAEHLIDRAHHLFIEHSLNLGEHCVGFLEGLREAPRTTGTHLYAYIVHLAPQQPAVACAA